jgi:hypothetical protein
MSRLLNIVGSVLLVSSLAVITFDLGSCSRNKEIEELSLRLAKSEETVEVGKGLYSTAIVELKSAEILLDGTREEISLLEKQLEDTGAKLLTAQQLTIKWKNAYEAILNADQVDLPPDPTDTTSPIRKRVNFSGKLGPIQASGYTITDPAQAFLKLEQIEPLVLTVAVAQNKDGTWTSYTTSSDDNVGIKVNLAGVSPRILSEKWRQRIWFDVGAAVLGDYAGTVGMSYRGSRYSLGAFCFASAGSLNGCGATLGVRIFK